MAVCKKCGGEITPDGMQCSDCGHPTLAGKFTRAGKGMETAGSGMHSAGCSVMWIVVGLIILVPLAIVLVAVGC